MNNSKIRGNQDVGTSAINSQLNFTYRQVVYTFFRTQNSKKNWTWNQENREIKKDWTTNRESLIEAFITAWCKMKYKPPFHHNEPWDVKTKFWPNNPFQIWVRFCYEMLNENFKCKRCTFLCCPKCFNNYYFTDNNN